jgi:hypothetical protein
VIHGYSPFVHTEIVRLEEIRGQPSSGAGRSVANVRERRSSLETERECRPPSVDLGSRGGDSQIRSGPTSPRGGKESRLPRGGQGSADSPMPAGQEQTSRQIVKRVETPAFFRYPVGVGRVVSTVRGRHRRSRRDQLAILQPIVLKLFYLPARFAPHFLPRPDFRAVVLAGPGSLTTASSSSRRRRPAAQSQAASSAISAKLNCGSGNGKRPSASVAVGSN